MKLLSYLLLLSLFDCSLLKESKEESVDLNLNCQNIKSQLKTFKLNGKVKSMYEVSYIAKNTPTGFEKVERGWESMSGRDKRTEFDRCGRVIKIYYYGTGNKNYRVDAYKYDGDKLVMHKELNSYFIFKYEGDNLIERTEKLYRGKGVLKKEVYEYNSDNKLTKTHYYDAKNKLNFTDSIIFDEETRTSILYEDSYMSRSEYDSIGRLKVRFHFEEGVIYETEEYEYKGELVTKEIWTNYDESDIGSKIITFYDYGHVSRVIETDAYDQIEDFWMHHYEFDFYNNWVYQIINHNDKKFYLIERTYEYYE